MAMRRKNYGVLIAAVSAAMLSSSVNADVLLWDSSGVGGATPVDGTGGWDTATTNWVNAGVNVTWNNATPDSAVFGTGAFDATGADTSFAAVLATNIVVQDITLGTSAGGGFYNIIDTGGAETLTINGNVTKNSSKGGSQIFLTNALTLAAGNHTFALRDTPGDLAELTFNSSITGSGGIIIDNTSAGNEQFGTLLMTVANTYSGGTTITKGRLAITNQGALGSGAVVIDDAGALAFGGGGTDSPALNITSPITIKRNDYTTANHTYYGAAIIASNDGTANTHTISGPLIIDSIDGRIQVDTNTLVISSDVQQGPNVAAATLTLGGNFAGFVSLTGNNTALLGGIKLVGGVQVDVTNENNLGGPTAPLQFAGSGTLHPIGGFMTNFGTHVLNNTTFSGGINVDDTQTFTIDQALGRTLGDDTNRVGSLGKRGLGTMNINSAVNLRAGQSYWDAGVVNVNSTVELGSLHLRSAVVNIGTGGSVRTVNGFNSFGESSTGTNGGPDISVINISGTGALIQNDGADFNISDNANTKGTINISGGTLTAAGITSLGKSNGAIGTINQTGGAVTLTRNNNFGLVLGNRRGTGIYNMSGGTVVCAGEMYVGQGNAGSVDPQGVGIFDMSGGTFTQNNSFNIGREGAGGTVTLRNGAVFIKAGAANFNIDGGSIAGVGETPSVMTVDAATLNVNTGEFRVGTDAGANGTLNVRNGAIVTCTNWLSVGRLGATGTLNLEGGTITKTGSNNTYVGESANQNSVINVSGGTLQLSNGELWLGNAGSSKGVLNLSAGAINVNNWIAVGRNGTARGEMNITGGTLTKTGGGSFVVGSGSTATGLLTQTGGAIVSNSTMVGESGTGVANLSAGTASLGTLNIQDVGPSGTLNISGTAAVTAGTVLMGRLGTGTSTINLSGGSFKATSVATGGSAGLKTFSFTGGTLNVGTFSLSAGLNNSGSGTLVPGGVGTIGTTAVTAGYTQSTLATLAIDIAGDTSFDKVTAGAVSTFNGTLSVDVLGAYSPVGITFDVLTLTAGTLSGTPVLGGPDASLFTLSIIGGNILRLSSIAQNVVYGPGDVNHDHIVDQLDLNLVNSHWQQTDVGLALGDANQDGIVDQLDLNEVNSHWQQTTSGRGLTVVPEPTSLALLGLAGFGLMGRRRRA